jgi:hypothetical protein
VNLGEKKPIIIGVCVLAIIASFLSLFITQCERSPKVDVSRYAAASEGLARKMGQNLPSGTKMVLVTMDPSIDSQVFNAQLEGFDEGFKQYASGIKEIDRYVVKLEDMERGTGSGMPAKIYFDVIEKYPDVDVIASLVGIPLLTNEEIDSLPWELPQIHALVLYGVGVKRAFDEGLISAAVLPRYEKIPEGPDPSDPEKLFDKYYQYVTEENYDGLTY